MNENRAKAVSSPGRALTLNAQGFPVLQLKQEALESIARTPEVRCRKVQEIKAMVDQGSYHGDSRQVAVNLIADHFLMTALAAWTGAARPNPEK